MATGITDPLWWNNEENKRIKAKNDADFMALHGGLSPADYMEGSRLQNVENTPQPGEYTPPKSEFGQPATILGPVVLPAQDKASSGLNLNYTPPKGTPPMPPSEPAPWQTGKKAFPGTKVYPKSAGKPIGLFTPRGVDENGKPKPTLSDYLKNMPKTATGLGFVGPRSQSPDTVNMTPQQEALKKQYSDWQREQKQGGLNIQIEPKSGVQYYKDKKGNIHVLPATKSGEILTPEGLKYATDFLSATGTMLPTGLAAGARVQTINEKGRQEALKGEDNKPGIYSALEAGAEAKGKGRVTGGNQIQLLASSVARVEDTLPLLKNASNQFGRADVRFLNTPFVELANQGGEIGQLATNYLFHIITLRTEYQSVLSRGYAPQETDKAEAAKLFPDNITPAQLDMLVSTTIPPLLAVTKRDYLTRHSLGDKPKPNAKGQTGMEYTLKPGEKFQRSKSGKRRAVNAQGVQVWP